METAPHQDELDIGWIHLSDLHLAEKSAWSQDVVLKSMKADIERRFADSAIDLLFVTGDLAFSGKSSEYKLVRHFLLEVAQALDLERERIFPVPGNHDIDRAISVDAFNGARAVLCSAEEVDRFLADGDRRRVLFRRQAAYRQFANGLRKSRDYTRSSCAIKNDLKIKGVALRVLRLDSSWLSEGGKTDSHALVIGEKQLYELFPASDTPALNICLVHHPFSWLAPFEQSVIESQLTKTCSILLRGHIHEDSVTAVTRGEKGLHILTAGAAYESRQARNSYSHTSLNVLTGKAATTVFMYRHDQQQWIAQEAISWELANTGIDLEGAIRACDLERCAYWNYLVCLVSGRFTDIPIRMDGSVTAISRTSDTGLKTNIGGLITKIGNLVMWQKILDQSVWEKRIRAEIQEFGRVASSLEVEHGMCEFLTERERQAEIHTRNAARPIDQPSESVHRVAEVLANGDHSVALMMISRLKEGGELNAVEQSGLKLLEIQALSGSGSTDEAADLSAALATQDGSSPESALIAAGCARNAKRLQVAKKFIVEVLNRDKPGQEAIRLAMAIASDLGDSTLVALARSKNVG